MTPKSFLPPLALSLAVAAALAAGETRTYGRPLQGLKATPLADVLAKPVHGQTVRLEGEVKAVCVNKGCWLELAQQDRSVHVTFAGYSFFVPKDSQGQRVALEGLVLVKEPTPKEVEHLEGEGAGAAASSRVSIQATGVELAEAK